jgi:hypothetical protein
MAAGLLLAVASLFMIPMSVREVCTLVNRNDFILDELQLDSYSESSGNDSPVLEGHLISTGERYVFDYVSIVGLDRLRQLQREKAVEGYRLTVRYLPRQKGLWAMIDRASQFRVRSLEDFDQGFPAGLVAANIVIAVLSIVLIRRGVRGRRR